MGANGEGRLRPDTGSLAAGQRGDDPNRIGGPAARALAVRGGAAADAQTAADLHARLISDGFLSLLGPRFLERLYRRISLSPTSFLLIAECHGDPVGFIAGSTDVTGLYRTFLWKDGLLAALSAAGPLVSRWRRAMETLRHGTSPGGDDRGRGPELLAVAVDGTRQGQGVGRLLVASFLDEVGSRGDDAAHVVVGADNARAVALYERAGFVTTGHFELHPGTGSLLMQWDRTPLPPSTAGGAR